MNYSELCTSYNIEYKPVKQLIQWAVEKRAHNQRMNTDKTAEWICPKCN
jgi:hypothetical protein